MRIMLNKSDMSGAERDLRPEAAGGRRAAWYVVRELGHSSENGKVAPTQRHRGVRDRGLYQGVSKAREVHWSGCHRSWSRFDPADVHWTCERLGRAQRRHGRKTSVPRVRPGARRAVHPQLQGEIERGGPRGKLDPRLGRAAEPARSSRHRGYSHTRRLLFPSSSSAGWLGLVESLTVRAGERRPWKQRGNPFPAVARPASEKAASARLRLAGRALAHRGRLAARASATGFTALIPGSTARGLVTSRTRTGTRRAPARGAPRRARAIVFEVNFGIMRRNGRPPVVVGLHRRRAHHARRRLPLLGAVRARACGCG